MPKTSIANVEMNMFWDWAFIASGLVLGTIGWHQIRAGVQAGAPRSATQASSVPHPEIARW